MLKLAVIFESSPFDRKGLFNAVHNRIRHLVATGECEVDVFCVHSRDTAFTRRVRHTSEVPHIDEVTIEGIRYRLLWYRFSIIDHLTVSRLHRVPFFFTRFLRRNLSLFRGYDRIIAHSLTGGLFAREIAAQYSIPYFITWHGSDVHTHPWRNPLILKHTRSVMEGASCNFFVSGALMAESERITSEAKKDVLYNGVSDSFGSFPPDIRKRFRMAAGVNEEEKVVAFVGNLVPVKNVSSLYSVFSKVRQMYSGPVSFWIVGDGKLRSAVERDFASDPSLKVRFWGNVDAEEMPDVMNCVDVLVLPSRNEGLPLVCAEALVCGANVVGSRVGGIPEIIGNDYTVPHSDTFAEDMASMVASLLNEPVRQRLPEHISWPVTASKELSYLKSDTVRS